MFTEGARIRSSEAVSQGQPYKSAADAILTQSSLNLMLAAIVVCNTVHMQACLWRSQADGEIVSDDDLRYLSPLMRRHLGLSGQYNFNVRRSTSVPTVENFNY